MRKIVLLLAVILIAATTVDTLGRRKTTRPTVRTRTITSDIREDTLNGNRVDSLVSITGYEKPLRANFETIFVAYNDDPDTLSLARLDLRIEYFDMSGAMLHSRTVTLYPEIPGGERHLVRIPTWDRNNVFYYHLNTPRTKAQATPYRVRISTLAAVRHP